MHDLDNSIPGWVDLFGKDPPPGWTCAPLEDWDFDSQTTDSQPACADQPAAGHLVSNEGLLEEPVVLQPTHPVSKQDDLTRTRSAICVGAVPAQQSESRTASRAVIAAPMRTPRGWCSPVDMLIPRGASLYCSRYRRRYGLPNARASSPHRAAYPVVLPLLVTWVV